MVNPTDSTYKGNPCATPILINTDGGEFWLTNWRDGVRFDLAGTDYLNPRPVQTAWTQGGSGLGFLVLDRNGDGLINNASELFGNYTPQPPSAHPNGFLALAEYDKVGQGGNGDGEIDDHDAVFPGLSLWQDVNHNGVSEPEELHQLKESDVYSISLDYREARRRDRNGNYFRYRAKVEGAKGEQVSKWAWDVFLSYKP